MNKWVMRVAFLVCQGPVLAQAEFAEQFYTNGKHIDTWNAEPGRKTTMWFSREPGDKVTYRESLVIIYDEDPEWAYYVDLGTKKFMGRYSFRLDRYSVLPKQSRRTTLDEIPDDAFPEPGELPSVNELLLDSENTDKLADPPPTKAFPKLTTSAWDSTYLTAQRARIRARIDFSGEQGRYRFQSGGQQYDGSLDNIRYQDNRDGTFLIEGKWNLDNTEGYFRFIVAQDNLNTFQGEWGSNGSIDGTWNGNRLRQE